MKTNISPEHDFEMSPSRGKWVNFGEVILVPTFEIPSDTMKPIVLSYSASTVQLQPPQGISYHEPQPRCRSWGNTRWAPFWASRKENGWFIQKKSGGGCGFGCCWMYIDFSSQVELLRIGRNVPILQKPRRPRSHFQSKPSCLIAFFASDAWNKWQRYSPKWWWKIVDWPWYKP